MSNKFTRLFKEPLIQFLIIGAAIYGAYAMFATPEEDFRDTLVHVDSNRINAFISEWEARWNRPPTPEEIDGLIQSYIKEDVLYRQAVAMGLNEDDPITRRRMAQKLEFLTSDLAMMVQPAEGVLEQYFIDNSEAYQAPDWKMQQRHCLSYRQQVYLPRNLCRWETGLCCRAISFQSQRLKRHGKWVPVSSRL